MKERIAEFPITEWDGARIQVTVSLPQFPSSLTTQRYIDSRELDQLKHLSPPKHIDAILDNNPDHGHFLLIKWQNESEAAKRLVKAISDQIAWQIGKAIEKAFT